MKNRSRLGALVAAGLMMSGAWNGALQAQNLPFKSTEVARLMEPWAMAFLPDGRLLVTERAGALKLVDVGDGSIGDISGVPEVA